MEVNGSNGDVAMPEVGGAAGGGGKKKERMSIERIYQKKSQLEHILLRPDTYIGSVVPNTEKMWVLDAESQKIVNRETTFVPGLYKIFDEILVNAADNKVRDAKMDMIKIEIHPEKNEISIYNNGLGIPLEMHKGEKMYVPTMIFGHLLTSSNFNDEEEKVTGGRNGYGAKLCNVFSNKFTVETGSKKKKQVFRQSWSANMSKAGEVKLKDYSGEDFTKITFYPDLPKFNMEKLDDDTVGLLSRRAYDIAASTKGVKVTLNGKRIPVKNFKEYVDFFIKGHEDETGQQIKAVHETVNDRWEIAVAVSDNGFQQMSFCNSIATTKGGRHVDYVSKMVEGNIAELLKKKNKGGVQIKPHQVRNHMWLFINCLIVNPSFDSQTKELMTLQQSKFGSKCAPSPKFYAALSKSGILESVLAWSKFKADQELKGKSSSKKTNKLKGISKLEDANDAGTRNSIDCTLILTEGDSAKTLAVAGLGVIGRDKYGVYPLRGKLLNVREASHKQIMENKEINEMVKIIGLTYKKKYTTTEDLKALRYGKVMIMTDQDQDGSHIKGLLINFIHHNWPGLLRLPFLEEFITPIVKATKGSESFSFFSLPEFTEWKDSTQNWHTYKIKYYKGLGTSTSKEAKEYFSDMKRHRIFFNHQSEQDDYAINLAFSKKEIEKRKEWLTNWMEECKRRRDLGLSEIYLYEKNTRSVTYSDFINKELVLFSNADNERSIPSLVDGFKPGQRKVIFTCLKRNDKREVKVAQLAGSIGEMSAYHHGEMSLMGTIINLAQNFVGSNNINLLQPIGQFGTRLAGGKDHASARYIFTQMSPLTRLLFNVNDDPIMNYLKDDNQKVEPDYYVPIIPLVLVNGADGIGTGWMTKIPNYNPRDVTENILRMLDGGEPKVMTPWFKNFKGTIESLDNHRYVVNGEIASIADNKIEITELPVRTWTQSYKESTMEPMLNGSEKQPAIIQDYKEYHTDKTVKFIVQMAADKLRAAELDKGLHAFFKLQGSISTSSMVLFDAKGVLRRYDSPEEILKEFYEVRLDYYERRKKYMDGMLSAEAQKLSNQARFILEKCDGSLVIENKKKKKMIEELQKKGFDADPVKKWKKALDGAGEATAGMDEESDSGDGSGLASTAGSDYDYLLGMAMWSLTFEKKEELLRKKDEKVHELNVLRGTSKEDLWRKDLQEFLAKLEEVEAQERADDVGMPIASGGKAGKKGGSKKAVKVEAMPSPVGVRIAPRIGDELRQKAAKAAAAKASKGKKGAAAASTVKMEDEESKDEFDFLCSNKDANKGLSERIGIDIKAETSPSKAKKAPVKRTAEKKAAGSPGGKKKKSGKNPWSGGEDDAEMSEFSGFSGSEDEMASSRAPAEAKKPPRRAGAGQKKFTMDDDSDDEDEPAAVPAAASDSDSDFGYKPKETSAVTSKPSASSSADAFDGLASANSSFDPTPVKSKPKTSKKVLDSDSDTSFKNGNGAGGSDSEDDDMFASAAAVNKKGEKSTKAKRPAPKKTAAATKKKILAASDSEGDFKNGNGHDSDDEFDDMLKKSSPAAAAPKAKSKPSYAEISDDEDMIPSAEDNSDLDESFGSDNKKKEKKAPAKPKAPPKEKKPKAEPKPKKPKAEPKPKKEKAPAKKKKKNVSDSEDDFLADDSMNDFGGGVDSYDAAAIKVAAGGGRAAAKASYKISSDDESDY